MSITIEQVVSAIVADIMRQGDAPMGAYYSTPDEAGEMTIDGTFNVAEVASAVVNAMSEEAPDAAPIVTKTDFETDIYSQFLITSYLPDGAGEMTGNLWLKVSGAEDTRDKVIVVSDVPCYTEGDVVAYEAKTDDVSCRLHDCSMVDDGDDIVVTMRLRKRPLQPL